MQRSVVEVRYEAQRASPWVVYVDGRAVLCQSTRERALALVGDVVEAAPTTAKLLIGLGL